MGRLLWIGLLVCGLTTACLAGLDIAEPIDKLVTFDQVINLAGQGKNLTALKVNGQALQFDVEGNFRCGLVLQAGKNLVEISAWETAGRAVSQQIRILNLLTFPDIEMLYDNQKHWARLQIVHLSTLGLVEAYPDGNFYPAQPVSRGELATWLARLKGLTIPVLSDDVFFDVPKEHWRAPYIKAAVNAGYLKPLTQEIFGLGDPLSRREAADLVVKVEGVDIIDKIKPLFVDVTGGETGSVAIYSAQDKGLLVGMSRELPIYDPNRPLNRAEAVMLCARFNSVLAQVKQLFDFDRGYGRQQLCRIDVAPEIQSFTVEPATAKLGQPIKLHLQLTVRPREKFFPMSKVQVDLRKLGGAPDAEMFDQGKDGDRLKEDLTYSLDLTLTPQSGGNKIITATAIDRLGWESKEQTSLLVLE